MHFGVASGFPGRESGTPRDSLHLIDLIYSQDGGHRPEVLITDTGSYSDIVFGLVSLLGFDYRPQLADLPDAKLWRIDPTADYGPLNATARGRIDHGRIFKTRHVLSYVGPEPYRREIKGMRNLQETRHDLARHLFHAARASSTGPTAKAWKTSSAPWD